VSRASSFGVVTRQATGWMTEESFISWRERVFFLQPAHTVSSDHPRDIDPVPTVQDGSGALSRCSYLLWAGRSGDRMPMGARFSAPVRVPTVSFPGVKRPGRGVDHPPHLAPRFKKEQGFTSTPPLGLRGLF